MPGRIWHTMSSHHPSPASAEVVMFGGTCQNLFATREPLLNNISGTTIMHRGELIVSDDPSVFQTKLKTDWEGVV